MIVHVSNLTHRAIVFNFILFGNVKNNQAATIILIIFDFIGALLDNEKRDNQLRETII